MARDGRFLVGGLILAGCAVAHPLYSNEYLIKWKSQSRTPVAFPLLEHIPSAQLSRLELRSAREQLFGLTELRANPDIEYVVENKFISSHVLREPTRRAARGLRAQWSLQKIGAAAAWSLAHNAGNRAVIVAVLDTGVEAAHLSLAGNLLRGYDFVDHDHNPTDEIGILNAGHGTHCAGVVGANGQVEQGADGECRAGATRAE